jgi:16S rRNA (guanine(527)-N(7))-methyltransferase RsmG
LNLTSVRDLETIVLRHYCESLFVGAYLPSHTVSVVDVGSGAGFPGIPMAILRPDCRFALVESHRRKAVFLRESTRALPNVVVSDKRADEVRESFDWLVSRAVRWTDLRKLVPTLAPRISLLTTRAELHKYLKDKDITWRSAIDLPWGNSRILLMSADVSRGT